VQVDFYQLGRTPLPRVLAQIAGRVLAGGNRLLVVTEDDPGALDAALWEGEDSFLPHGRATADDPGADQPVLIDTRYVAANGARCVALADGRWRPEALGFDRAFHLFDEATVEAARTAWRELGQTDGVGRNYWAQDEAGRWAKKA
jgi:DNA polymerase III subunit chi